MFDSHDFHRMHHVSAALCAFDACNSVFRILYSYASIVPTPYVSVSYIRSLNHPLLPHTNGSIRRDRTNTRWQLQCALLSELLQLLLALVFHHSSLLEVCDLSSTS